MTFVSASGGGLNNSGVVNWSLGILTNGQATNLTLTVTALPGAVTNVAVVTSTTADPNLGNNTNSPVVTAVTPVADVAYWQDRPGHCAGV